MDDPLSLEAAADALALAMAGLRLPRQSAALEAAAGSGAGRQLILGALRVDEASPQGFYLPDAGLEELADCFAVVDGTRLPLHSQVLGAQSAVLRDLFRSRREAGAVAEVSRGAAGVFLARGLLPLAVHPALLCGLQTN